MASRSNTGHPRRRVHATLDENVVLDEIRRLQTSRHHRDRQRTFFIEGVRNFVQIADNGFEIAQILYSEKLLTAPLARKLVRQFRRDGVPTHKVSPESFRQISKTHRASGIGAIVRQRWTDLHTASPDAGLCWLVLGQVRSAGNLGTLIRTAEAVGCAGFILLDESVDPYDPQTVRASMGSHFRQQFIRTDIEELSRWIHQHGCPMVGASPDGPHNFHHFSYAQTRLILLGEERQGLTDPQRELCDHLVHVPMVGQADSLNLGVAGSLFLYEVLRGRLIS